MGYFFGIASTWKRRSALLAERSVPVDRACYHYCAHPAYPHGIDGDFPFAQAPLENGPRDDNPRPSPAWSAHPG